MAGGGDACEDGQVAANVDDMMMMLEDEDQGGDGTVLERVEMEYRPTYQRFVVKEKSFTQQYSHLYTQRLVQMRDVLRSVAKERWIDGHTSGMMVSMMIGNDCQRP